MSTSLLGFEACKVKLPRGDGAYEGDYPCEMAVECPTSPQACLLSACWEGQCVYVPAPEGSLPAQDQKVGDCQRLYCDGHGEVSAYAAPRDFPRDDHNPCTEAVCDLDVARQEPKVAGTPCGQDGVCTGRGICGVCVPEATKCVETSIATCDDEGQWSTPTACAIDRPRCRARGDVAACVGVQELAAGAHHACARFEDGSVTCWGAGGFGQLGRGAPSSPSWATGYAELAAGFRHACGRRSDGSVWCWGAGDFGQLGQGKLDSSAAPTRVGLSSAMALAVGRDHSCALETGGLVRCWGRNDRGQAGSGQLAPQPEGPTLTPPPTAGARRPEPVMGMDDAAALRLGPHHTCVLRNAGQTACWGLRTFGSLPMLELAALSPTVAPEARPTEQDKARYEARKKLSLLVPQPVVGLAGAARLGCGDDFCCVLRTDDSVSCWGAGKAGQLGDGRRADRARAEVVSDLADVKMLGVGRAHACALHRGGHVSCWGDNTRGQLGATGDGSKPRELASLDDVRHLAVGGDFACAQLESGPIQCWGDGAVGQLGREVDATQPAPVEW